MFYRIGDVIGSDVNRRLLRYGIREHRNKVMDEAIAVGTRSLPFPTMTVSNVSIDASVPVRMQNISTG